MNKCYLAGTHRCKHFPTAAVSTSLIVLPCSAFAPIRVLRTQVIFQVTHARKPLPTVQAVVRVLPRMHHRLVPLHGAKLREPQATRITNVQLLSRVGQLVSVKGVLRKEAFPAQRTRDHGTVSRVPSHFRGLAEALAAELTLAGPLLGVHFSVVSP